MYILLMCVLKREEKEWAFRQYWNVLLFLNKQTHLVTVKLQRGQWVLRIRHEDTVAEQSIRLSVALTQLFDVMLK